MKNMYTFNYFSGVNVAKSYHVNRLCLFLEIKKFNSREFWEGEEGQIRSGGHAEGVEGGWNPGEGGEEEKATVN